MLTVLRHSQRNWTSELRAATGRSAISHLIKRVQPRAVLMPSYVPEGVLVPFQKAGIQIRLYKLREDLRPDLDHVQRNLCDHALFVLIHYFGYLTETGALREILNGVKGILFEDCAHALFHRAPDADVALWVYNKFLPVVDGAVLRSRKRSINVTSPEYSYLPSDILDAYHEHLDLNSRIFKLKEPKQVIDTENESIIAYENYYKRINSDLSLYSQSPESRCIIASTDLELTKTIRSQNALTYYKHTPECFRFKRGSPVAPFAHCIVVRPPFNCEKVYEELLKAGVLPARCIDKWDHVPKGDARFENEHTFMDQHLLLPVGEEVTHDDIRRICDVLKRCAGEAPKRVLDSPCEPVANKV